MRPKHSRTVHKERISMCKVKTEPRSQHLQELQDSISKQHRPFRIERRSIELNKRNKRTTEGDLLNTSNFDRRTSSNPTSAVASRQRFNSFLPSLNNEQTKLRVTLQRRNEEIIRDYSEPSQMSSTQERRSNLNKTLKLIQKEVSFAEPEETHPDTLNGGTQRTDVSVSNFFEYTVKYSCRTAVGRLPTGKEKTNQDCFVVVPCLNRRTYKHFFAVCDGHGVAGHEISQLIKRELTKRLAKFHYSTAEFDQHYKRIIEHYFSKVEDALNREKSLQQSIDFSGSTCTSVWLNNSKLYCASVGDSRAIIVCEQENIGGGPNRILQQHNRIFTVVELSKDHKVDRTEEAERIQQAGGQIGRINGKGPLRIWKPGNNYPGMSMSRSFGDRVAHSLGVISIPEIFSYQMTRRERIMVIASDGLWQFMSNSQVVELVSSFYDARDIDGACRTLMEAARQRWQQHCKIIDDITFLVFFFGFS